MATPTLGSADFLFGHCPVCARQVLTHIDLGPADEEVHRCLHCDEVVTDDLNWVGGNDLDATGYTVVNARTCGNGGGCSTGCGMRQRT